MTTPAIEPPPATSARLGNTHVSTYEQVTNRIIALLEAGTVPWQKPWKVMTGMPRNLVSKRPYRGINLLMLMASDFESPFWLTFRQANELGGHIRKGEKATPVVFWKQLKNSAPAGENSPEDEAPKPDPTERKRSRVVGRLYSVFNVSQTEGLKNVPSLPDQLGTLTEPAKVYENMPDRPAIKHGMRSAFYSPLDDVVGLPTMTRFSSEAAYYSALWHELDNYADVGIMAIRRVDWPVEFETFFRINGSMPAVKNDLGFLDMEAIECRLRLTQQLFNVFATPIFRTPTFSYFRRSPAWIIPLFGRHLHGVQFQGH